MLINHEGQWVSRYDLKRRARQGIATDGQHCEYNYVSVYSVSRCYGGPEEGGWYYDWWELVKIIKFPCKVNYARALHVKKIIESQLGWKNQHHRSSVLGGDDCEVILEVVKGENQSRRRPHYE